MMRCYSCQRAAAVKSTWHERNLNGQEIVYYFCLPHAPNAPHWWSNELLPGAPAPVAVSPASNAGKGGILGGIFWLVVILAVVGMCSGGGTVSSSGDSSYDSCVAAEIEKYQSDPFWEYEGNEAMYAEIAEGLCE